MLRLIRRLPPIRLPGAAAGEGCGILSHTMLSLLHSQSLPWACMLAAGLLGVVASSLGCWRARGSTAVPATLWAMCAAIAVACDAGLHAAGWVRDPAHAASLRLCVTALLVCPAMSVLGAKRPQHGIWQVIVASLAVVLAMPAASAEFVRPGSPPVVHIVVRVFLSVLAVIGWMNYVGTWRRLPATLVTLGGVILIRGFLPGFEVERGGDSVWLDVSGSWLLAAGGMLALPPRVPQRSSLALEAGQVAGQIDQPFLCLRETLGTAWTLRIAERFNGLAESRGWPCRLEADGLEVGGDPLDRQWQRDAIRTFESIMRRFVSVDWLERHRPRPDAD